MPPIRKGDGTAVTPKGISQISTGDGRILFDAVAIPDTWVERPDDDDTSTDVDIRFGIRIISSQEWPQISVEISGNTDGVTEIEVYEPTDDDPILIGSETFNSLSTGDVVTVDDLGLETDTEYTIVGWAEGDSYQRGYLDNPDYNIVSDDGDLSIIDGVQFKDDSTRRASLFRKVGNSNLF